MIAVLGLAVRGTRIRSLGAFVQIRASRRSHRAKICLVASLLTLGLAGCGSTNWGFPYRTTIQQGNWITSEQVAQLEVGMTRDQVRFVLGTPTLQDAFHADRWDYPYYNQPGYGKDELRKFTVWFQNDRLVRWAGDAQPDRQPFQKVDTGREAIAKNAPAPAAPAAGSPTPAAESATPAAESATPAGSTPPATGSATPTTDSTAPAANPAAPATEHTAPAASSVTPADSASGAASPSSGGQP